ncbi:sigma-54-dependent transcriptional regulator [Desulfatibacillum aliphaticivorans]|uniref:sigma-54-dependent transcriptional regulator n=1 Tax=Desulfatibacillum aliphaticivorans TaxID=218208 RepID=UPI000420688A|nr:sigma-54 dependent transcriptional regulator [Desulfatibacillum aliphaticivorans]
MFPSILIVDDEPSILDSLGGILTDEGFEVVTALNGYEAIKQLSKISPDLMLLDIWMPGMDGLETLKQVRKEHPSVPVVMITGHGTIETAVQATKLGAYDFIEKPLSIEKVVVTINNALNFRRLEEENLYLRKKALEKHSITGFSPAIMEVRNQINTVAPTDSWVLISGENGTGKEMVARTIHHLSARSDHPMVTVNCASISKKFMESELFGHEKGAFPGAKQRKRGRFELANQGTLFFDEVGDMDMETQSRILRVLENQKFQRVGGGRTITVDVRVIASTNKNLEEEIIKGAFREDLYYRLNVVPIAMPPLKERAQDIPSLCEEFFKEFAAADNLDEPKTISQNALEALMRYPWPGNVRELRNLVERLVISTKASHVDIRHIPPAYKDCAQEAIQDCGLDVFEVDSYKDAQKAFEIAYIQRQLVKHDNDPDATAAAIGMDKSAIKKILKKIR